MKTRVHKLGSVLATGLWLAIALRAPAQSVHYVDNGAAGPTHDGKSWCTAFLTLQDGLAAAAPYDTIRVAQGTYTPDEGPGQEPGDRSATFEIVTTLGIYGGFAGCGAPDPGDRDIELYDTILSGDLQHDDELGLIDEFVACFRGPNVVRPSECTAFDLDGDYRVDGDDLALLLEVMNYGDNSYHIVTSSGWDNSALLDGFSITGGNAYGEQLGAGLLSTRSRITVNNCTFLANASSSGAALHIDRGSVRVSRCRFVWNCAGEGGSLSAYFTGATVSDCTFDRNAGSAMVSRYSDSIVSKCTLTHNTGFLGAGLFSRESDVVVEDCQFIDNHAYLGGAIATTGNSTPIISDSTFSGNYAHYGGALRNGSNTVLRRCSFSGNSALWNGGAIANQGNSLTATACTFAGNTAYTGGAMYNSYGHSQAMNCVFSGNSANLGGAVRLLYGSSSVANCTFSENDAGRGAAIWLGEPGDAAIANSIFWNDSPDEIFSAGRLTVGFSNVQGGLAPNVTDGGGNIDADPLFLDPAGADSLVGTTDDDVRLLPRSPCIDAADNWSVPPDTADLDGDGFETEITPLDVSGNERFVDDPATWDTGVAGPPGYPEVVDMGAHEFFSVCGNSVIEPGEECDRFNNETCGEQVCRRNCTCAPVTCGNGVRDAGEGCDGNDDDLCRGLGCGADCTCRLPKPLRPMPEDVSKTRLGSEPAKSKR